MPAEPKHRVYGARHRWPWRDERARNHHDREPERARGYDFGNGGAPARVLRQNRFNPMFAEQADVVSGGERPACLNDADMRQIGSFHRGIDKADYIGVLRRGQQLRQREAANSAEHDARLRPERGDGRRHIRHLDPSVFWQFHPGRAFDSQKRSAVYLGRLDGVAAHLAGERVGGIDQNIDAPVFEMADEPFYTAKSATAHRNRLSARRDRSARERQNRVEARIAGEQARQRARFR